MGSRTVVVGRPRTWWAAGQAIRRCRDLMGSRTVVIRRPRDLVGSGTGHQETVSPVGACRTGGQRWSGTPRVAPSGAGAAGGTCGERTSCIFRIRSFTRPFHDLALGESLACSAVTGGGAEGQRRGGDRISDETRGLSKYCLTPYRTSHHCNEHRITLIGSLPLF